MFRFIAALSLVCFLAADTFAATPAPAKAKAESVELTCRLVPTKGTETSAYRCTVKRPLAATPTTATSPRYNSRHPGVRVVPLDAPAATPAAATTGPRATTATTSPRPVVTRHPGVRVTALDPADEVKRAPKTNLTTPLPVHKAPVAKPAPGIKTVVVPPAAAPLFPKLSGPDPKVKIQASPATARTIRQDAKRALPVIYAPRTRTKPSSRVKKVPTVRKIPAAVKVLKTKGSNRHGVRVTPID